MASRDLYHGLNSYHSLTQVAIGTVIRVCSQPGLRISDAEANDKCESWSHGSIEQINPGAIPDDVALSIGFENILQHTLSELTSLPVSDRLRIVESLWNSIDADTPASISPEQREEINRRIERHESNPDELLTWEQVLDGLRDCR